MCVISSFPTTPVYNLKKNDVSLISREHAEKLSTQICKIKGLRYLLKFSKDIENPRIFSIVVR